MTEDQCEECGDVGWVETMETLELKGLVPCSSCLHAGRVIPRKPVRDLNEELDEVDDYIGWEEI